MAEIVLGIGTSHTPLLSIPGELWPEYAKGDRGNPELVFPPDGISMPFAEAVEHYVSPEIQGRLGDVELFKKQFEQCKVALDTLAATLAEAEPDIIVIISDDQDEWFYDGNMPSLSIFWGDEVPLITRTPPEGASEMVAKYMSAGYGDKSLTIQVASKLGRHLLEHCMDNDFDVAQMTYVDESYGGRVARHYPTATGELDVVRETKPRPQGIPHGFSFVVKRLLDNKPPTILPIIQNTCYPPNQVRPGRSFDFGREIARGIASWPGDERIAIVASGGLSHFVVDEELDRTLIQALLDKDEKVMRNLPRHRLYSATSESLNWVAAAGVLDSTPLEAELVDYVPVYRTEAGTGGGWTFMRWQ